MSEDTQTLPTVAPRAAGRAVLVYAPRRPLKLLVFTMCLVALTTGVVLGQAQAWQPSSNPVPVPVQAAPVSVAPHYPDRVFPATLPLGAATTRTLELSTVGGTVRLRTSELGGDAIRATAASTAAVTALADTESAVRIDLTPTGGPGAIGADIELSPKVIWKVKIVGAVTALDIEAPSDVPVRVTLTGGGRTATVDGKPRTVGPGAVLLTKGWKDAKKRYDVEAVGDVRVLTVTHTPVS